MFKKTCALFFSLVLVFSLAKPVNAGFFDDVKSNAYHFFLNLEASIPFLPKSPKAILWKMSEQTVSAKSATIKLGGTAALSGAQAGRAMFELEIKGAGLKEQTAGDADMTFNVDIQSKESNFKFKGALISKDKVSYFRLDEGGSLGFFDLSKIKGQWYKIPASETPAAKDEAVTPNEKIVKVIEKEVESLLGKAEKLGDEQVEGKDTYTLKIVLTSEDVARIQKELSEALNAPITETIAMRENVQVKINVYKSDFRLSRLEFKTKVQMSTVDLAMETAPAANEDSEVSVYLIFKDYNLPFVVTAPAAAKEFDAADLMGGSLGIDSAQLEEMKKAAEEYKNMKPEDLEKKYGLPSGVERLEPPPGYKTGDMGL